MVERSAQDSAIPSDIGMAVAARTMAWARGIVVGLNLCPFARAALEREAVRTLVTPVTNEAALRDVVEREANILAKSCRSEIETTLIVAREFAPDDFLRFHAFASELEASLEADDYFSEQVMVACFHPEHCWGDADSTHSAVNFDKRAPYPIINLLRYDQVCEYVDEGLTDGILAKNKQTLSDLGSETLREMYRNLAP